MWLYAQSGSRPQEPVGGVDAPEVTPVPIPNTTVKGRTAEGTTLETAWENRWMPPSFKKKFGISYLENCIHRSRYKKDSSIKARMPKAETRGI